MTSPSSDGPRSTYRHRRTRGSADRELSRWLSLDGHALPAFGRHASATLLRSPLGRAVELHVFPGRSPHAALVVAGVHGTEHVGVDVARGLIERLRSGHGRSQRPYFTTIVVAALFPDNLPASHGGAGYARRSTRGRADPNRQFPAVGTGIDSNTGAVHANGPVEPRDAAGRPIERANVALLGLIGRCRPRRIASIHAIKRPSSVGIYSDPHPGSGADLAEEAAQLAARMHFIAKRLGDRVPGPTTLGRYPYQDTVDNAGVSLGAWASRPIESSPHRREAIPVITLELKRDWPASQARQRRGHVEAFMLAIRHGFLEP